MLLIGKAALYGFDGDFGMQGLILLPLKSVAPLTWEPDLVLGYKGQFMLSADKFLLSIKPPCFL